MATTITAPAPYSSVKESLIFEIDRTIDGVVEVEVNDYLKQLPRNAYKVNVAHYYRENFTIVPVDDDFDSVLHVFDGLAHSRVVEASITVDQVDSDSVPVIYADKRPGENRFMSDLRRRAIMPGQVDELPVYVTAPAVVAYGSAQVSVPVGISCVGFRVPADAPSRFVVELRTPDGGVLDRIEYEIEENDGVRLAWINVYGQIDYWNFAVRRKSSTKIAKEKIYTESGYIPTSMQMDTTETIISRPLPEVQTDVLCQVFVAEDVWLIGDGEVRPVDITSESVTTYEAEKLSSIQVEYRNKIREL